jgi:hypothetical protein
VKKSRYPRPSSLLGFVIVASFAVAGCGYHFAASGDMIPSNAQTIYVERFGNNTRETGVNDELMRYIKDEIAMHKRLTVVDSPDGADLELSGTVKRAYQTPINFNSVLEPTSYRNSMYVSASLKDLRTKKVIWSAARIGSAPNGPIVAQNIVTTTPSFLQQNLRGGDIAQMTDIETAQSQTAVAQDTMMSRLAHTMYVDMSEGF